MQEDIGDVSLEHLTTSTLALMFTDLVRNLESLPVGSLKLQYLILSTVNQRGSVEVSHFVELFTILREKFE